MLCTHKQSLYASKVGNVGFTQLTLSNPVLKGLLFSWHNVADAKKVYLVSNTKLASAIGLYKKYGFQTVSEGQHPIYSRANIVMERHIL
jgi:hypothetical protein